MNRSTVSVRSGVTLPRAGGCPGGGVGMYHAVLDRLADGGARDRPTHLKTGRLR